MVAVAAMVGMVATEEPLSIPYLEARHLLAMVVRVATELKAAMALVLIKMVAVAARAAMAAPEVLPSEQMALQAEAAPQLQEVTLQVATAVMVAPAGLVVLALVLALVAKVAVVAPEVQVVMAQEGAQAPVLQWFALRRKVALGRVAPEVRKVLAVLVEPVE